VNKVNARPALGAAAEALSGWVGRGAEEVAMGGLRLRSIAACWPRVLPSMTSLDLLDSGGKNNCQGCAWIMLGSKLVGQE
jgi:hypothetical protein